MEENRIGEVIEASTAGFTAQCYELYGLPPLGSLVKTRDLPTELYGIVCSAATTSVDPGRRPIARGRDAESQEEIYQQSPQLAQLLRSEFSTLVVGHRRGDEVYHYLPPKPAKVHSFVYLCPDDEVRQFSQSFAFLNMLINTSLPVPVEELVSACLRQMSQAREERHAFLVAAGKELATLLGGQFSQLRAILERIRE